MWLTWRAGVIPDEAGNAPEGKYRRQVSMLSSGLVVEYRDSVKVFKPASGLALNLAFF